MFKENHIRKSAQEIKNKMFKNKNREKNVSLMIVEREWENEKWNELGHFQQM